MPKGKKGLAMDSANAIPEGIDTFENDTETNFADKEVDDISSKKPLKKAKGRPKKGAKTEVHSNGETDQNGVDELSKNDTYEVSDKNSSKTSSEDDKNSNQESENEDMGSDPSIEEKPQKKKVGRKRKDIEVSNKTDDLNSHENNAEEGSEKNDDPETSGDENKVEEEETKAMPKKKGGRKPKKTGRGRKPAPSKEEETNENEENENLEEEETEVMPKKRGGKNTKKTGRGRKPASSKEDEANENQSDESEEQLSTIPEEKETDDDDSAKPQKAAPSRGRGRKPAAAAVEVKPRAQRAKKNVATEPEKAKTKGRKRKTPPTETVDEAIYKKLNAEDLEEAKNVKVSLVRQQDIDDMALDLMKSEEGKVQAAAGTSGKGRGKKRAAESEDSASTTSKKGKATASKAAAKREKIPDVNALDFDNKSTNAKGKSWNLKIATWNVNGLRAWLEKDGLTYLTHEDPDVLCIQETKCSEDKIPPESNPVGYHCYWVAGDKEGYSGVGLMSKQKPLSVEYGIRKKVHDGEGRVITAEYEEYYLVATYVPNAGRKLVRLDYRKQWDIDFRAYLKKLDKTKPVILCGDLNVAHNEIDLANPKTNKKNAGFTQEERDGFSSLLSEGFVDAFRHLYPDTKGAYTFWTYMSGARAKNVGWRLDYFVLSEKITENLCDCVIRKDVMGSDHCPLVLFLRI